MGQRISADGGQQHHQDVGLRTRDIGRSPWWRADRAVRSNADDDAGSATGQAAQQITATRGIGDDSRSYDHPSHGSPSERDLTSLESEHDRQLNEAEENKASSQEKDSQESLPVPREPGRLGSPILCKRDVTYPDRTEVKRDGEESSPHRRSLCAELGASRYLRWVHQKRIAKKLRD